MEVKDTEIELTLYLFQDNNSSSLFRTILSKIFFMYHRLGRFKIQVPLDCTTDDGFTVQGGYPITIRGKAYTVYTSIDQNSTSAYVVKSKPRGIVAKRLFCFRDLILWPFNLRSKQ